MEDPELLSDIPMMGSEDRRRSMRVKTPSTRSLSARSTPVIRSAHTPQVTPEQDLQGEDATPSKRAGLRKRNADMRKQDEAAAVAEALKPLTSEERMDWKGWVELESDPAQFNYILRKCGIQNVKVQDDGCYDDLSLAALHQPVYGLIFLFKWKIEDEEEVDDIPKCPKTIWFANQTITNACATIALLNIVMNVAELDLGDRLKSFKTETQNLKPPYRGQKLGQNDFVRNIHNSFARKMDILNADLALSNDVTKWKRATGAPKRVSTSKANRRANDSENGYHFIAYVPVNGEVWRLDGLQRQPASIGQYTGDWTAVARENVSLRIAQYTEDGCMFNLMALSRSPLCTIPEQIAQNIKTVGILENILDDGPMKWKAFATERSLPLEPNDEFKMTQAIINNAVVPGSEQKRVKEAGTDAQKLLDLYSELIREQNILQVAFMDEVAQIAQQDEEAERRKQDYTPAIYNSVKKLAEEGLLQGIVQDVRAVDEVRRK